MTKRNGVIKTLSAVFAALLLAVSFAGCGEYKPPVNDNTGGGSTVTPGDPENPDNPDNPDTPDDPEVDYFTAQLTHYDGAPFTSADRADITSQRAQWTEIGQVRPKIFRAYFNADGIATAPEELDGDFRVTLVLTDSFSKAYCYDPNPAPLERRNELVATNYVNDVKVRLHAIKTLGETGTAYYLGTHDAVQYYTLTETGAYAYTFNSKNQSQMFCYKPQATEDHKASGEYSFMTMMDITADEVNPKVGLYTGNLSGGFLTPATPDYQDAAEGNYTKNIWLKYYLTDAEAEGGFMGVQISSESEKTNAYPITIYFIFERDGEFTSVYDSATDVPVTEDFSKKPANPSGTLRTCAEYYNANLKPAGSSLNNLLNQNSVKLNEDDGYYYYINPTTGDFYRETDGSVMEKYRLYAYLSIGNAVHDPFTNPRIALYYVCEKAGKPAYNYREFIATYVSHCEDGVYPVNEELKTFLQRYAVSQRLFNDGYGGFAESTPSPAYNSDEDSQWMYACGTFA